MDLCGPHIPLAEEGMDQGADILWPVHILLHCKPHISTKKIVYYGGTYLS